MQFRVKVKNHEQVTLNSKPARFASKRRARNLYVNIPTSTIAMELEFRLLLESSLVGGLVGGPKLIFHFVLVACQIHDCAPNVHARRQVARSREVQSRVGARVIRCNVKSWKIFAEQNLHTNEWILLHSSVHYLINKQS